MTRSAGFALLLVLIAVAIAPDSVRAQAGSERTFAADMIRQLKRKTPGIEVVPQTDPLAVKIKGSDWDGAVVNFHRIYGYCQNAAPADCATSQAEFLEKVLAEPPNATAQNLRIAVRDKEYVDYARAQSLDDKTGEAMIVARPIGDDLFAILVADGPDSLALVSPKQLRALNLSSDDAWAKAWLQTRLKLPALPGAEQLKASAVAFQDQEYLASLFADTGGWKRLSAAVGPNLFATVVADNFVFVSVMADGAELAKFKQAVREDCAGQQRCISPNLYRFRDGNWVIAR